MAALDWVCIVVLVASLLIGAWRGLVFELLSLAGWVVAFFLAQWFAESVGAMLPMSADTDQMWRHAAGFVLVFVGALFACSLVAWLLKKLIDAIGLRPADRALGGLFGLLRGLIVLLALALVTLWTPLHEAEWWKNAQSAHILEGVLKSVKPVLPSDLGEHIPV